MSLKIIVTLGAALVAVAATPALAQQASGDFYKGKTLELMVGYSPGGGYDTYGRLMARHLGNHSPGKPQIVVRNMPGGGGRVLMGHMANVAPKDGSVLAVVDQSLPLAQAMRDPTIHFDAKVMNYIGNPDADNNTVATWHTTGVKTVEDARKTEVIVGSTGPNTSSQIALAMNATLGTKFKVVTGYPGGNEINMAMETGEAGARASSPWATWKSTKPDWVKEHKINIIAQVGLKRAPDLPDVPLLIELATNDEDRAALRLLSAPSDVGRPLFTTPGVPAARVTLLRRAFDEMMKDPAFLEDARKLNADINPVTGEDLQKIVADIVETPPRIADRLTAITALPGNTPAIGK
jgi:tripartite-type tricarboxylate transporter receptor subunit TctC